jgi:hypothetical protein
MFETTVGVFRWGFKWLIVLAVSASLAFALTRAISASPSSAVVLPTVAVVSASPDPENRCTQPLGNGVHTNNGLPELSAPPAWCGQ